MSKKKKVTKKVSKKEMTKLADVAHKEKEGLLTIAQLQRKAWGLTDDVVAKLSAAFRFDFTVREACSKAGIAIDTYYKWRAKSNEFCAQMDAARHFLGQAAKQNIARAICIDGSVVDSWQFLKRRQKDVYSDRVNLKASFSDVTYKIVTNADISD